MKTINPNYLESSISYSKRGVHGFPQMNTREEPQGFKCALCLEADVKDEGDYCGPCAAEQAEYECEDR